MDRFAQSAWADNGFSRNYLEKADIYIMERRKMFSMVASLFRYTFPGQQAASVLDLGCGDGVLTHEMLKTHDALTVTLVDGSQDMIDRAQEKLGAHGRCRFVRATFQEMLGGAVTLGEFDAVVSSQAIHHLSMDEKSGLFRLIYRHLRAGGLFLNIDVVLPPSERLEEMYFALWKEWMQEMMDRFGVHDEKPDEIIRRYKSKESMNAPDTLEDQLEALLKTGFSDVDCFYKNCIFVVFGGKRP